MEVATGLGELDAARSPVEQPCTEPILKLSDTMAYRRFGYNEPLRPGSKPAG